MTTQEGFDRGVKFSDIKKSLIDAYNQTLNEFNDIDPNDRYFASKRRKKTHRLLYILIAIIQLFNGSRISEACKAFRKMLEERDFDSRVKVKISKSESIKYKKDGEQYTTKPRYRFIIFPIAWVSKDTFPDKHLYCSVMYVREDAIKKRVLDYLLKHHECNTHSLRYAYINHMLYVKKTEPTLVAKHVGHSNTAQLVRYTQRIESDKLFDMDL
jgi:hypothetical protein